MASNTVTIEAKLNTTNVESGVQQVSSSLSSLGTAGQLAMSSISMAIGNLVSEAINSLISSLKNLLATTVEVGMSFEDSMAKVQAISGASGEELEQLTNKAKEMGATTKYTASEAADALSYMALAGWTADESCDALDGVLNLAAASGMDLAKASDVVTDYITAFGLEAGDAAYMADLMVSANNNANTSAEQLGEAWGNCATYLAGAGQDVETVSAALMVMANSGLKGSEAGTALKAIMRDISNNMEDGAIKIGDVSVSVADADGNFRDLNEILADVQNAVGGLGTAEQTAALSTTFTSYSLTGLNAILGQGVECIDEYEEVLRESGGTAEEVAGIMQDTLSGDLTKMGSAFEAVQVSIYEFFEPALREGVQTVIEGIIPVLQTLADNMDTWVPIVEAAAVAMGVLAVALNIGTIISTVTGAISGLGTAISGLFTILAANPIAVIIALVAAVITYLVQLYNTNEEFRATVQEVWAFVQDFIANAIQGIIDFFVGLIEFLAGVWDGFVEITQTIFENISAFISSVLDVIQSVIETVLSLIKAIWSGDWEEVSQILSTIWDAIKNVVSTVIESIKDTISNIIETIKSIWNNAWTTIKTVVSDVWESIKTAVSNAIQSVKDTISNIIETIKSIWDNAWTNIKTAASNAWENIKTSVSNAIDNVKETIANLPQNILNLFANAGTLLLDAGKNIIEGLKTGIKNAWDSVVSWIKDACGNLVSTVLGFFGIASPSKVFAEIGEYLDEGLAVGIEGNMDIPTDATIELATAVAETPFEDLEVGVKAASVAAETKTTPEFLGIDSTETLNKLDSIIEALQALAEQSIAINLDGAVLAKGIASASDKISGSRQVLAMRGVSL